MPPARHLLIPFAAGHQLPRPERADDELPHLAELLRRLRPQAQTVCEPDSPAMPYEQVLAGLLGLPAEPGRTPWAAFETRTTGLPCGWVKPCHLQVGADQVRLGDTALLALEEADSRALLEAAAPYFAEDGMRLSYMNPTAWLATGEPLRDLLTWSTERLAGRQLAPDVLRFNGSRFAALWRRLQNEMQMLFYTHRVNDERAQRGQLPVNAIWLSGAGELATLPAPAPHVVVDNRLCDSALALDATAYRQAWQTVDADSCSQLLQDCRAGQPVRLTLAGERSAITYAPQPASLRERLGALFGARPSVAAALDAL
ncbi:phosphoglycerate mutase [Hydrogenophaga sp.]|uniref:phosphoglycerate mutase n=1 Tax=Hydrogenophaga sp. TaxID=1904254 RepID=UPI002604F43F|nr:phosphoglycerate mutase [Hydrogenophaga sp.]MCW5653825.1 phosphoglycerate mutase [Hydrogenophaga sp.]